MCTQKNVDCITDPLMRRLRHVFVIKQVTRAQFRELTDHECRANLLKNGSTPESHDASLYDTFYRNACRNLCADDTTYKFFKKVLKTYFHMDDTQVELVLQDTGDGTMIREALFGPHVYIPATMLNSLIREVELGIDAKNIELTSLTDSADAPGLLNEIAEVREEIATAERLRKDALSIYAAYAAKKLNLW